MLSPYGSTDASRLDPPKSGLVHLKHFGKLDLKFSLFDSREIPMRVLEIAAFAFDWFCQPSCFQKIYLSDPGFVACAKNGPVEPQDLPKQELPHSIRKLNSSSFILTLDRKDPTTLIGEGVYKKVKKGWLIHLDASYRISTKKIGCAKDKHDKTSRFFINYLDLLPKELRGIESQSIYFHETSKGTYKKFHHAPLALCDASQLPRLHKTPSFTQLALLFLDLTTGAMNLLNYSLLHGDLKPDNILIYHQDGKYFAKFCDLSSVGKIGDHIKEQNFKYLSSLHRYILFRKILETHTNPSIEEIKEAYSRHLESAAFTSSYEAILQSLGLVFADIALSLPKSKGSPEEMELFWSMIFELTGFRADSESFTSSDFHQKMHEKILKLAAEETPPPLPKTCLIGVKRKLTDLVSKKRPIQISLEKTYETTRGFSMRIEGGRYPKKALEFEYILAQILKLFKHATLASTKKIYFNDSAAYIKQASGLDNPSCPNSIKCLSEGRWIVILNRKSKTTLEVQDSFIKKKYGWEITSSRPNQFIAQQVVICTDMRSKMESCDRWAMERLRDLTCVECPGERFSFQTSDNHIKELHIAPPAGINGFDFAQSHDKITFPQFLQICSDTLTGIAELHENDLIYGNLKPNKIVIFNNPISGDYSAKISASSTCMPLGNICSKATLDYLSPRIRHLINSEVSTSIPDPTYEQIQDKYYENPLSFNIIITPEDETATAGIILSELAVIMKNTLSSTTSENRDHFWRIISSLIGSIIAPTSFSTGMTFFQNLNIQIANTFRTGPPRTPTISLRGAASEIKSICI